MSRKYASVKPYQAIIDIGEYGIPNSATGGPDPAIYQASGKILDTEKSHWLWSNILLRLIANPISAMETLLSFSEQIETEMSYLPNQKHSDVLLMSLIRGIDELLQRRGAQFGWTYPQVEELRTHLTRGLVGYIRIVIALQNSNDQQEIEARSADMDLVEEHVSLFVEHYTRLMERRQGPFAGCKYCPSKCLYRTDTHNLLTAKNKKWITEELTDANYDTDDERYQAVVVASTSIAQSWLGDTDEDPTLHIEGISYCAYLHTIARPNFSEYEQIILSNTAKDYFFKNSHAPLEDTANEDDDDDDDDDKQDFPYFDDDDDDDDDKL